MVKRLLVVLLVLTVPLISGAEAKSRRSKRGSIKSSRRAHAAVSSKVQSQVAKMANFLYTEKKWYPTVETFAPPTIADESVIGQTYTVREILAQQASIMAQARVPGGEVIIKHRQRYGANPAIRQRIRPPNLAKGKKPAKTNLAKGRKRGSGRRIIAQR